MVRLRVAKKVDDFIELKFSSLFKKLYKAGLRANHLTLMQIPLLAIEILFFIQRNIIGVITVVFVTLFLDIIDGSFARATHSTDKKGHIYDKLVDLAGIIVFVFGIGMLVPEIRAITNITIIGTLVLYGLNEITELEVWGGSRLIGPVGLIVNQIYVAMLISLITTMSIVIYKLILILKNGIKKN